jgi:hypothetical protein
VLAVNERFYHIAVDTKAGHRVLVWKILDSYFLIIVVEKGMLPSAYMSHIEDTLELMERGK